MKYELIIKSKSCKDVIDIISINSEAEASRYISDFFEGFNGDIKDFYYELFEL